MLILEKLPKELVDMIMELVGEAKSLYLFLFSRALNPHVKRAMWRNLDLVVWNPHSKSSIEAKERGKWPNAANMRKSINSISLLVDKIHESQCLLEKTTFLSIRLSKWNPGEMAESCTGIPKIFYHNSPLATHYFNTGLWDSSLAAILSRAPQVQELMCDWIGPMPFVTAVIPTLVNIRKLTIRGMDNAAPINEVLACICSRRPFPATLQTLSLKHIGLGPLSYSNPIFPERCALRTFEMVGCVAYGGVPSMRRLAMTGIVHARIANEMESESWSQLPILSQSRTTLQTLELLEESPRGDEEDQLVETRDCFIQFAKFTRLRRLKVSWWNTPHWQPDLANPERNIILKALTNFEIVVNEYDMRLSSSEFLHLFKMKLALFDDLHIFPELRTIKLVPSPWAPLLGHNRIRGFEPLCVQIQQDWENTKQPQFFGWERAPSSPKDDICGIYRWSNGISLDITALLPFMEDLSRQIKMRSMGDEDTMRNLRAQQLEENAWIGIAERPYDDGQEDEDWSWALRRSQTWKQNPLM